MKKNYRAAIAVYSQVLDLWQSLSTESADVAIAINALATVERDAGDLEAAERYYREALRIAYAVSDDEGVAIYTGNLASLALMRKDWLESESLARKALKLSERVGRQELIASNFYRLAKSLVRQGRHTDAHLYVEYAVDIFTKLGSPRLENARAILAECEV